VRRSAPRTGLHERLCVKENRDGARPLLLRSYGSRRHVTPAATSCRVFGLDCFAGGLDEAASSIVERASSHKGGLVSLLNVHLAMTSQRRSDLLASLQGAWRVFPDGAPIAWLERRKGATQARRVAGADLMLDVMRRGSERRLRHFLFGSTPDVLAALERGIRHQVGDLEVVGTLAPPPGRENDDALLSEVRAAAPDIVWVGLGAPKQELWAQRHAPSLSPSLLIGVGAAFDFHAGKKQRAPRWMQRCGLEWLHRLISEPRRLGWRYFSTNTLFALAVLREVTRDS
jgi:N-acetylglucosaminyldiphosphoundecaprenol N-acetyl-beta-D-mannosaminyltransferase